MNTLVLDRPRPIPIISPAPAPSRARAGELYARYADELRVFARKLLRDASAADDVVQDVFLRVLTGRERHDPRRASERTWLRVLVRESARAGASRRAREAMESLDTMADEEDAVE